MQPTSNANQGHILIYNNGIGPCGFGGAVTSVDSTFGVGYDYVDVIGNAFFNAAISSSSVCNSFVDRFAQYNLDNNPGIHNTTSFNIAWGTVSPTAPCDDAHKSTDRNFEIWDRSDHSTSGGGAPYTGMSVSYGNLVMNVGGTCFHPFHTPNEPITITGNTCYHNLADWNYANSLYAEIQSAISNNISVFNNVVVPNAGCASNSSTASFTGTGSGTSVIATAVTGWLQQGSILSGTGVPVGAFITAQPSGTPGGAGTYNTSATITSSGAALTAVGAAVSCYGIGDAAGGVGTVADRSDGNLVYATNGFNFSLSGYSPGVGDKTSIVPAFVNPVVPTGAPSFNGFTNIRHAYASTIAGFRIKNYAGAQGQ